jgi:hypothetical protein
VGFLLTNYCKNENVSIQHGQVYGPNAMMFVANGSSSSAYATLYCSNGTNNYAVFRGLTPQNLSMQTFGCISSLDYPVESFCGSDPICAQR